MSSYVISVVYICRIISCLKGFTLFYHIPHTHIWNAYVAGNLLEIKTGKMKHAYNKAKKANKLLHICGVMLVFLF